MSIFLILASLFGIAAGGLGLKDCLAIKEYKEEDAKTAEVVGELENAIALLKENEEAYLDGIGAYTKGLSDYNAGKSELNKGYKDYNKGKQRLEDGYAEYNEGKRTYEEGLAAYEEGKKQLEEGKKQVAEGQALIDTNTQAYLEGKEKLAKIEPLLPYVDFYLEYREKKLTSWKGFANAQAWFAAVVRPIAANNGLEIPADVTDFPAYIEQMVADGKAQLKEYEDGLKTLEEGKKQVAEGEAQLRDAELQLEEGKAKLDAAEKQLADGEKELKQGQSKLSAGEQELREGAAKLEDGLKSLEQFEDGMKQVDGYTEQIFTQAPVYRHNGELAVANPQIILGEDFSWYKLNDNGEIAALRSGDPYLDLDKCMEVCTAFRTYVANQGDDVANELYSRLGIYIALAVASLLGLVAGILGLAEKGAAAIMGIIIAVVVVGSNIFGALTRYFGYTYPLKDGTYSGTVQLASLLFFAVAAVLFAVAAMIGRKKAKRGY